MRIKLLLITIPIIALIGCSLNAEQNNDDLVHESVVLKIISVDGTWVKACITQGGALRIKEERTGEQFSLFPVISESGQNIALIVYRVINTALEEKFVILDRKEISLYSLSDFKNFPYHISVDSIKKSITGEKQVSTVSLNNAPADTIGTCCVTCKGVRYCSNCAVFTSCGCCSTEACPGECSDSLPDSNRNKNKNSNSNSNKNVLSY